MLQTIVDSKNFKGETPLYYGNSTEMIRLLLTHGADPNITMVKNGQTVFDKFLESMPEGCNTILNHYIDMNGSSLGGTDLKVTLDFRLFHRFNSSEMAFLHKIVISNRLELLKHPICESFLHLKWFRVRKYFYSYVFIYLIFLFALNGMALLDLSPVFQGKLLIYFFNCAKRDQQPRVLFFTEIRFQLLRSESQYFLI